MGRKNMNKSNTKLTLREAIVLLIATGIILSSYTVTAEENKIQNIPINNFDNDIINDQHTPILDNLMLDRSTLFFQRPYFPDENWEFYTSDSNAGDLCTDDFEDVDDTICRISWWGLSLYWNGVSWVSCVPVGIEFEIIFYDGPPPGNEVNTYSNLYPSYTKTGLKYSGFDMYLFEVDLNPGCSLSEGWVSIQSTSSLNDCWFRWSGSPDHIFNAMQNGNPIGDSLAFKLSGGIPFNIDFGQIDFYYDENIIVDSSWGTAKISYEPGDDILFFNFAIDYQWIIKNFPIMPIKNEFILDFNLGNHPGVDVKELDCACKLTYEPIDIIPDNYELFTDLKDIPVLWNSGEKDEVGIVSSIPNIVCGSPIEWVSHDSSFIFNQPQGLAECVPTAISNSLKFLKAKHNLNLDDEDISIEKMKAATEWDDGCPFGWWNKMEKYLIDNEYRIATAFYTPPFDIDEIMQKINLGNDVLLRVPGHAAMVLGILKFSNGNYLFAIAHDTYQGPSGNDGEEIQYIIFDSNSMEFIGGKWFNGRTLKRFVVESPINQNPSDPKIDGPTSGIPGENYTYTFVSRDPDDDDLYYEIDWGDGNVDPWDGPHSSNTIITREHSWDSEGTYLIKARVKDGYGGVTDWVSLKVNIPRSRMANYIFLSELYSRLICLFNILKILT
jgi:hypothetical protein